MNRPNAYPRDEVIFLAAVFVACCLAVFSGGCVSRAELSAQREFIAHGTDQIRADRREWSRAIAGESGAKLPDLSTWTPMQRQAWLAEKERTDREFTNWLTEGRRRDAAGGLFGSVPATQP